MARRLIITPQRLVWVLPGRDRSYGLDAEQIKGFAVGAVKYGIEIHMRVQGNSGVQFRATREIRASLRTIDPELLRRLDLNYMW